MRVVYDDVVGRLEAAIRVAQENGRLIKSIEITEAEAKEFVHQMRKTEIRPLRLWPTCSYQGMYFMGIPLVVEEKPAV